MKDPRDRSPDGTELRQALQDLSTVERWAEHVASGVHTRPYAAPEPWEGPQLSVETRTENGMHTVAGIAVWPPGDDACPAVLDEKERVVLRSLVRSLLDLAGHESGTARTRVVLTPVGPRVAACQLDVDQGVSFGIRHEADERP
ncbi:MULTISPECIES: hypothetical protein [unclassified Streptomyces]|uniref:hypothetical protein n=1 Tax=unclassified Streptomyces TaxID=2593676 RepID=UPI0020332652|nr:hypothetical protein [Streptomyces sp. RKAG290]MCM2415392.1 hypothetical protein [Streptomyces sp. RKAG290]